MRIKRRRSKRAATPEFGESELQEIFVLIEWDSFALLFNRMAVLSTEWPSRRRKFSRK